MGADISHMLGPCPRREHDEAPALRKLQMQSCGGAPACTRYLKIDQRCESGKGAEQSCAACRIHSC